MFHRIRTTLTLLLVAAAPLLLMSCSKDESQAILSHVPADSAYVLANLEPTPPEVLDAWLSRANDQIPQQVKRYRDMSDALQKDRPRMAGLMRAIADEMDGKTWQQILDHSGITRGGYWAVYALGLSPVLRGQLDDPKRFDAMLNRLTEAAGLQPEEATLEGITYRHFDFPAAGLQLLVSHHDQQYIVALLAIDSTPRRLLLVLGADSPDQDVHQRLQQLAEQRGYRPQALGYFDTAGFFASISNPDEPLIDALIQSASAMNIGLATRLTALTSVLSSPACEADFNRIAARVPQFTMGFVQFDAHTMAQRIEADLAPDIRKAFADIQPDLPGFANGKGDLAAFSLAIPMPALQAFWTTQARAVIANPFQCPALTWLNEGFTEMASRIAAASIPPIANLRGIRVVVDAFQPGAEGNWIPKLQARAIVALDKPESVLAMAQTMLEPLKSLQIQPDGQPVPLPDGLAQFIGQPAWLAMNSQGVALGIGTTQKPLLSASLAEPNGEAGQWTSMHLYGAPVADAIDTLASRLPSPPPANNQAGDSQKAPLQPDLKQSLQEMARSYRQLQQARGQTRFTDHGLMLQMTSVTAKPQS